MDPTERSDADITLGEVNRNVIRVEKAFTAALEKVITKAEFDALVARVKDIEESGKSKLTNTIAISAIIISAGLSIYQAVHS